MLIRPRLSLSTISTGVLLSAVALPISVFAFVTLYANSDAFWAEVWLIALVPAILLAALVLGIKDAVKDRSWRQIVVISALLIPTALLFVTIFSPRFYLHQLFSRHPAEEAALPANGIVLMRKFPTCTQDQSCGVRSAVVETQEVFKLSKMPEGCCSLAVMNGRNGEHKVKTFQIMLNGRAVQLNSKQIALVALSAENEIRVQVNGAPDSYIFVFIFYAGKKDVPIAGCLRSSRCYET